MQSHDKTIRSDMCLRTPFQCCLLKLCAPVQEFSHSSSLLWQQIFPTNVEWGARGSRLQVCLVVQDFSINRITINIKCANQAII